VPFAFASGWPTLWKSAEEPTAGVIVPALAADGLPEAATSAATITAARTDTNRAKAPLRLFFNKRFLPLNWT
jgi:hypothetical protein